MSFSVSIIDKESSPAILLKNESTEVEAEIYAFGALLNGFTVTAKNGKKNIIDGYASPADAKENITNTFKSAKLSPFVCRMNKGEYVFNNDLHKIQKFYLGEEAIHGLLYNAPFSIDKTVSDEDSASVLLSCYYENSNEGYPFPYSIQIEYKLNQSNTLSLTTTVTNADDTDMPLSDGWHPYFQFGETINDLRVQINSNSMLEFSSHLLPTGNIISYKKFETLQHFGDTALDNCFLLKDHLSPACIIRDDHNGLQLIIEADKSYPYLQVYTPPHRKSIAIENLSSAPDSFNNGIGLNIVKPHEQITFAASYQITLL
jgi:aldose 1-epimerase